jgi:hypothetical protein
VRGRLTLLLLLDREKGETTMGLTKFLQRNIQERFFVSAGETAHSGSIVTRRYAPLGWYCAERIEVTRPC